MDGYKLEFRNGERTKFVEVTSVSQFVDALRRMGLDGFYFVYAHKIKLPKVDDVTMGGMFGTE